MTDSAGALTSGAIVETSRNRQALTQDELALRADVSRSTVQKVERDDPSVSRKSLRKVAEALSLNMATLDAAGENPAASLDKFSDDELMQIVARRLDLPVEELRRLRAARQRLREFTEDEPEWSGSQSDNDAANG